MLGQRGGEELTVKLSAPRYNAARGTASYRASRLAKSGRVAKSAVAVRRRFGAASLSVAPARARERVARKHGAR